MKIPPLRRLLAEDFKEQAKWIDKLIQPINQYFEQTTSVLNRGLTLNENFAGAIKTVEVDGIFPVRVSWELPLRPVSVIVGNVTRSDGNSFSLASAVQVQWSFNQNGQLQIDSVVGITPTSSLKYKLTLECKAG